MVPRLLSISQPSFIFPVYVSEKGIAANTNLKRSLESFSVADLAAFSSLDPLVELVMLEVPTNRDLLCAFAGSTVTLNW